MISGKQGAGKSTLVDGLIERGRAAGYLPVRTRFASILYEMHDAALRVARSYDIPTLPKEGELLQWLGTEWGRKLKGENVWADATRASIKATLAAPRFAGMPCLVLVEDLRFRNEFDALDGLPNTRVVKVRLEASAEARRPRCSYWRENDTHPSETDLDAYAASGRFDLQLSTELTGPEQVALHLEHVATFLGLPGPAVQSDSVPGRHVDALQAPATTANGGPKTAVGYVTP